MSVLAIQLATFSVLLAVQSIYSAMLMLYAWEDENKRQSSKAPSVFAPSVVSFTVLLPARHEWRRGAQFRPATSEPPTAA